MSCGASTSTSTLCISHLFTSAKLQLRGGSSTTASSAKGKGKASTSVDIAAQEQEQYERQLNSDEIKQLNLFLKSKRSVVKLRISDIIGPVDENGEACPPIVRRGRIPLPAEANGTARQAIQCCLVGKMPFERCEIVAMVVKRNMWYSNRRIQEDDEDTRDDGERTPKANNKGKGRDTETEPFLDKEVGMVFYDLDDESGATITCTVKPNKVYRAEMQAFKDEQAALKTGRSTVQANSTSTEEGGHEMQPKSDPRLDIYRYYRYHKPGESVRITKSSTEDTKQQSKKYYEPPVHEEGSLLRVTGKIFVNPKNGERQLEALQVELIDTKSEGEKNKYAEWHHAREVKRLMREVYCDTRKVAELITAGVEMEEDGEKLRTVRRGRREHGASAAMETVMPDATSTSDIAGGNSTTLTVGMTTSLMDATAFNTSTSFLETSATTGKQTRTKLPSLRRIAEQKMAVTREIFLLYVQQHFRKNSRFASPLSSSSSSGMEKILDDPIMKTGNMELMQQECRISLQELKEDKGLDWLATKCAKLEAVREAELQALKPSRTLQPGSSSTSKTTSSAARSANQSIILPSSSSPCRAASESGKTKVHIRADYVAAKKSKLYNWAIQSLMREGVILVHLAGSGGDTPKAKQYLRRNCLCAKDSNSNTSNNLNLTPTRLAQHRCKCSPFSPPRPKQEQIETFSLITPQSLIQAIEPIVVRLTAYGKAGGASLENVHNALKRKDEMYRFVMKDVVKEAMEML